MLGGVDFRILRVEATDLAHARGQPVVVRNVDDGMGFAVAGNSLILDPHNIAKGEMPSLLAPFVQQRGLVCRDQRAALVYEVSNRVAVGIGQADTIGEEENPVLRQSLLREVLIERDVQHHVGSVEHLVNTVHIRLAQLVKVYLAGVLGNF